MSDRYWNREAETMPREALRDLQGKRLIETVELAYNNVKTYRDRMNEQGVLPGDIKSIDDIVKLPFMYKNDLRDNYPYGMFAVPMSEVVRIHASSGSTGKQTVVGYTRGDLDVWHEGMARSMTMAGVTKDDLVHVSYGYGLFTGGLGGHYGAETIGATTIPVSTGNTQRQLQIMEDFGSTVLLCTPSYAMLLGDAVVEQKRNIKLRVGLFGAEPWTENMRRAIEERLKINAFDIYGLSEISGPGVANECGHKNGLHVWEDHFYPEIIDPDSADSLPDGTRGELVFTCLTKKALPLIRYRTRDLSTLRRDECPCGRTAARMDKPTGRSDDMLIIRGVNVFPSQIEGVLLNYKQISPHYVIVVDRVNNTDSLEVQVEMSEALFSDNVRSIENAERLIRRDVENTLGLSAKIRLVEPRTIARSEGKAKRVIDNRVLL
ncbi:phenylacetate-coenzyme A ligase [Clostridia bacterium]|nr:phenylacetate-coenzyme A ligase [Clostridia bacterium]